MIKFLTHTSINRVYELSEAIKKQSKLIASILFVTSAVQNEVAKRQTIENY